MFNAEVYYKWTLLIETTSRLYLIHRKLYKLWTTQIVCISQMQVYTFITGMFVSSP